MPLIVEMYLWGEKYLDTSEDIKKLVQKAKKDKNEFIQKVMSQLKSRRAS